jgi:hypothetical protein
MDKTIDMARESWIDVYGLGHDRAKFLEALKHFEALVRADEREIAIKDFKHRLAAAIDAMPFGDTAASFAVYIRDFK